jgi:CheY-like chemotaxis protein
MTLPKMSDVVALAEVGNLRRYAFCLLGNHLLSDMAVEFALNSLVADAPAHEETISRLDLYRRVNESAGTCLRLGKVSAAVTGGLQAKFARLPMEQRQIAALHTVAGLPYADIASIMTMTENDARRSYIESLHMLRGKPMTVLIIEDETLIAWELCEILTNLGLSVAGTARNRAEALRIVGLSKPKLILADYQLKGDTGVDVVKAIRERIDTDVIYVTSHPDVTAASRETPRDIVIAKPFDARAIERAVQIHLAA